VFNTSYEIPDASTMLARREIAAEETAEHEMAAEERKVAAEIQLHLQDVVKTDTTVSGGACPSHRGHQQQQPKPLSAPPKGP